MNHQARRMRPLRRVRLSFMHNLPALALIAMIALLAAGCRMGTLLPVAFGAGPSAPAITGDPARGAVIFQSGPDDKAPPCTACHLVTSGGYGLALGPNLAGISERGASRIEGMTAEQYIEDSILHPTHLVVPGFHVSMYTDYAEHLSAQDVADLVAYLMTL